MEISDNRYAELLAAENDAKRYKSEIEEKAGTIKAFREEQKTLKDQIAQKEADEKALKDQLAEKDKTLLTKEEELKTLWETANKWTEFTEKEKQTRLDNIEKMKTDLGDKFDDNVKNFIEWLSEDKVESYLKGLIPSDSAKPPVTTDGKWGQSPHKDPNAFDNAIKTWSIDDALSALEIS